jgi:hypothetical protein
MLVGADTDKIIRAFWAIDNIAKNDAPSIYGDGHAADKILHELLCFQ